MWSEKTRQRAEESDLTVRTYEATFHLTKGSGESLGVKRPPVVLCMEAEHVNDSSPFIAH